MVRRGRCLLACVPGCAVFAKSPNCASHIIRDGWRSKEQPSSNPRTANSDKDELQISKGACVGDKCSSGKYLCGAATEQRGVGRGCKRVGLNGQILCVRDVPLSKPLLIMKHSMPMGEGAPLHILTG